MLNIGRASNRYFLESITLAIFISTLGGCISGPEPERWSGGGEMGSRHKDSTGLFANFETNQFEETNSDSLRDPNFDFLFIPTRDTVYTQKVAGAKYVWSSAEYENISVDIAANELKNSKDVNISGRTINTLLFSTTRGYIGKAKVIECEPKFVRFSYVLHKPKG